MSMNERWVNYDEALRAIQQLQEMAERQFVMRAFTAATVRAWNGVAPTAPFDLLFFVDTMTLLFAQRNELQRVLAGEDLRWWPEDQ